MNRVAATLTVLLCAAALRAQPEPQKAKQCIRVPAGTACPDSDPAACTCPARQFYCPCNKTAYDTFAQCNAGCHVTLGCFANICAPRDVLCKPDVSATFSYSYCCPVKTVPCNGVCVPDTPEERRRCRPCEQGGDACRAGLTCCSGECRNLGSDAANCGECGNSCGEGATCCSGECKTEEDFASDGHNCGGCGQACAEGSACCSGKCLDVESDAANCGECGKACEAGLACCSGTCTDLKKDNANCGRCGHGCGGWGAIVDPVSGVLSLHECVDGACQETKEVKCSSPAPYPCVTTCRQGGSCCAANAAECLGIP